MNSRAVSLKTRINQLTVAASILAALVVGSVLKLQAEIQFRRERTFASKQLLSSMASQSQTLLPLILLVEQRAGLPLVLEQIKKQENLDKVSLFLTRDEIPGSFKACTFGSHPSICELENEGMIAAVQSIETDGETFGYFAKIRSPRQDANLEAIQAFGIPLLTGLVMALTVFFGATRITGREVPDALATMIDWIK